MLVFFKLLIICSFAGFLAASLMWVFFWTVGVFDVPLGIKSLLKIGVSSDYLRDRNLAQATLRFELQAQASMAARLQYIYMLTGRSSSFDPQQVISSILQAPRLDSAPEKENVKGFYVAAGY